MKTKKYIFIAAAASMLGMTTSCDDEGFLTEKPKTIYTTDNSYETIDQVKACITNLYIHIRYWYQQDYFLKGLGTDVLDTPYFRSTAMVTVTLPTGRAPTAIPTRFMMPDSRW